MIRQRVDLSTAAGLVLDAARGAGKPGPVLVAIDGRCGSGKTTLAEAISRQGEAAVVHMDDFFLRPEQRTPERFAEPGGNVDRERFLEEVLIPLGMDREAAYRPYNAHSQRFLEPVRLERKPVILVEGSYSCHPALWDFYDLHIFLDVPPAEQLLRIESRNGREGLEMFRARWIPLEEKYIQAFSPNKRCEHCLELV